MAQGGPVFIGGTGRCGTTILLRILGRHPSVFSLRWESQFLTAPGGLFNVAGRGWRKRELNRFLRRFRGRWFHRVMNPGKANEYEAGLSHDLAYWEVEKAIEGLLDSLSKVDVQERSSEIIGNFTHDLLRPAVERAGARRWCEKTPRNILFSDKLLEAFPDMRFIHVIRDGRDVVSSMMARGFWPVASGHEYREMAPFRGRMRFELAVAYWRDVLELGRRISGGVPPENYMEIRFESLVRETEPRLRQICEFLGEDFDERLLEADLSRHHIGRWQAEFTDEQKELFERLAGDSLHREGYC